MTTTNEGSRIPGDQAIPVIPPNDAAVALLTAENERLRQRLKQLEEERERDRQTLAALQAERDAYRQAAYAWALAQITDRDLQRYAQEEEGLPLEQFIGKLEDGARAGKDA